jgi:hypothetical protein
VQAAQRGLEIVPVRHEVACADRVDAFTDIVAGCAEAEAGREVSGCVEDDGVQDVRVGGVVEAEAKWVGGEDV